MVINSRINMDFLYRNMGKNNKEIENFLMLNSNEFLRKNKVSFDLESDILKMVFVIVLIFVVCYIFY